MIKIIIMILFQLVILKQPRPMVFMGAMLIANKIKIVSLIAVSLIFL